jgi:glycosyltransferase involved in cell wall biosynthesis
MKNKSAVFIMPRSSRAWAGAEALWVTAAGWSAATKRKLGRAWVVTTDRIAQPEEVIHYPLGQKSKTGVGKSQAKFNWLPDFFKTVLKDVLQWSRSHDWKVLDQKPWSSDDVVFVWQQHDLFSGPGRKLATALKVPLVTYVHAPVVWETAKWGVKRYAWGKFLEHFVEANALKKSDWIACVSEEVAYKLEAMGVNPSKIVVSPMSVDAERFTKAIGSQAVRQKFGLQGSLIVGWTGSFRGFHGLEGVVRSFQQVVSKRPDARLMLVGDGSERPAIEALVSQLNLSHVVVFTGRVPFEEIPLHVAAFAVAVVSASNANSFHYSPLKLREYMAAQCAVLAPRAGEVPKLFVDEKELLLYTVGNENEMSEKMLKLLEDKELRKRIATDGQIRVLDTATWEYELSKIIKRLEQ